MIALAIVLSTALVCITAVALRVTAPKVDPAKSLGEFVTSMSRQHAEDLRLAHFRHNEEIRVVFDALISDRDRLLTAALAVRDPLAARAVGVIDQATARATAPPSTVDLMSMLAEREAAANPNEYVNEHGEPIVPVGMG